MLLGTYLAVNKQSITLYFNEVVNPESVKIDYFTLVSTSGVKFSLMNAAVASNEVRAC